MPDQYTLTVTGGDPSVGIAALSRATPAPAAGEQTGAQQQHQGANGLPGFSSVRVAGFSRPPSADYGTYEKVDRDDTVALVRSIVEGPIIAAGQKYAKSSDDVPDKWLAAAQRAVDPLWHDLVRDCLSSAFTYGNAPFELVWSDDRTTVVRCKPLRPAMTDYLADDKGVVRGVCNRTGSGDPPVELVGPKAFWWTYKGRFGDPYGTSRHDPIITAWDQKLQLLDRLGALVRKYSGVTAQLHYPEGVSKDIAGVEYPNAYLGKQVLDAVARGEPVMFPNRYAGIIEDNPKGDMSLAGKSDWQLSAIDLGTTGDYTKGILDAIAACDRRIVQGYLRPSRMVLEAEHGSRADAQQHTETGTVEAQLVANDICRAVTRGIVDALLVVNFGERARGAVVVESNPIDDDRPRMLMALVTAAIANPALAADVWQRIDRNLVLDEVDIPMLLAEANAKGATPDGIPPGGKLLVAPAPPGGDGPPAKGGDGPGGGPGDGGEQTLSARPVPAWRRRFDGQRASWVDLR